MLPSPALVLVFTAVFTVTGLRAALRLLARAPAGDRTADVSHLLMSIAMVGMAWGWPSGPDAAAATVQLVVFGVLAVVFAVRLLEQAEHPSPYGASHLIMAAAMVWMVLAMPAAPGHGGHGAASALAQSVTVGFVVLLCATAVVLVPRRARVPVPAAPEARALPRLDLAGQVLMRGGMAGMLLAML
jgi:hypothetical protein